MQAVMQSFKEFVILASAYLPPFFVHESSVFWQTSTHDLQFPLAISAVVCANAGWLDWRVRMQHRVAKKVRNDFMVMSFR